MASGNPFIIIGLGFSVLAGLAAFLITYEEWSRHYPDKREPLRHALSAAFFAFIVFVVLTLIAIAYMNQFILNEGQ